MTGRLRYLRVAAHLAKASIEAQMQYRADFLLQLGMTVFWVFWNVAPAVVVFTIRPHFAGLGMNEGLLVMAAFLILKAVLEGVISPNLLQIVQHIRTGTLDFVLLKPVDSMLMVSTARWVPAKVIDLFAGIAIGVYAIGRLDPAPAASSLLLGGAMLGVGVVILYSLWLCVVCTAFWFVRVDNLSFLFTSIFDAGRFPIAVFEGWPRRFLTYVLPVAVMTSFPALATLDKLSTEAAIGAIFGSLLFLFIARRMWRWAVAHYASASS
jgi:ABC-2 type transport system permease protein